MLVSTFITPSRRSPPAPALACPGPPHWTAPVSLANRSSRCKSRARSHLAHPSFFFPTLPLPPRHPTSGRTVPYLFGVACLARLPPRRVARSFLSLTFSSRIHGAGTSLYTDGHARQLTSTAHDSAPALEPWILGAQELGSRSCIPRRDVTPDPASPLPSSPVRPPSTAFAPIPSKATSS